MGRKKNNGLDSLLSSMNSSTEDEDLELNEELDEDLELNEELDEALEAEALSAHEDEEVSEPEDEVQESAKPEKKARKRGRSPKARKTRAKSARAVAKKKTKREPELSVSSEPDPEKTVELDLNAHAEQTHLPEPEPLQVVSASRAEPTMDSDPFDPKALTDEPAPAWQGEPSAELREDIAITTTSLHRTMDAMVKQWSSVKDISGAICQNFERVTKLIQETPEPVVFQEKTGAHSQVINKISVAVAGIAVVLSVLSLSLASSVRQSVLDSRQDMTAAQKFQSSKPTELAETKSSAEQKNNAAPDNHFLAQFAKEGPKAVVGLPTERTTPVQAVRTSMADKPQKKALSKGKTRKALRVDSRSRNYRKKPSAYAIKVRKYKNSKLNKIQ